MAKRISNESVQKNTGKTWDEWFALLNKADAKKMEHKAITEMLHKKHNLSSWWSQMVTIQYEHDNKGRKKHSKPEGYQISKTKTLPFSSPKVFSVIQYPALRKSWLENSDFSITRLMKNKSIRGKWIDGKSIIEFQFFPKEKAKTQLLVQHSKISSEKEAEKLKKYWERNLNHLTKYLEKI